jgi:hypothetical protein
MIFELRHAPFPGHILNIALPSIARNYMGFIRNSSLGSRYLGATGQDAQCLGTGQLPLYELLQAFKLCFSLNMLNSSVTEKSVFLQNPFSRAQLYLVCTEERDIERQTDRQKDTPTLLVSLHLLRNVSRTLFIPIL